MSLLGKSFSAATGHGSFIEGTLISHNLTNDQVTLIDEDNYKWTGYEYQLESVEE
ncbi:MAG: hypothetical protein ACI87J_002122 [Colwellia sp.]|jgi:hypothetical protein